MPATTQKVYQLSIELGESQQRLADAVKTLGDLKAKAAAANQEAKESKEIYKENAQALKDLAREGKALAAAKEKATAGGDAIEAAAAVRRNAAEQKKLNTIVAESKIVYQDAKEAADAAGAAVGKQAGAVKELTGGVKNYQAAAKAASQEFAPGTVGALRQEVIELRTALDNAAVGSTEAAQAVQQLAAKNAELDKLRKGVDALNPTRKIEAFTALSNAVTGSFSVMTVAAQAFGLSSDTAKQYEQKLVSLIAVMNGVEQISRVLTAQNASVISSAWGAAKAYFGMGEAAATGSKTARIALASTGIGALVVLVGFLVAAFMDWGSQVKSSESNFTRYKAVVVGTFDAIVTSVKDYLKFLGQLLIFDWKGAAQTARNAGRDIANSFNEGRAGVIEEARRKEIAQEAERVARYIDILKAKGQDTLALEVENAKRVLESKKQGDKDYLDATRDFVAKQAELEKRDRDERRAARLQFLNGLAGEEAARGADTFAQERAAKLLQIAQLRQAELDGEHVTQAQKLQLLAEFDELEIAHDKLLDERRRALRLARLNGELAIIEAKGRDQLALIGTQAEDELKVALLANAQKLRIAVQSGKDLRAQAQVDAAAVKANEVEQYTLGIERAKLYAQQQVQVIVEGAKLRQRVQAAILDSADRRAALASLLTVDPNAAGLAKRSLERLTQEQIAVISRAIEQAAKQDVFGNLFIKLFGVTDAQAQDLKGRIAEFAAQVSAMATTLITIGQEQADQRLKETQDTLQAVTDQLSKAQAAADATANELENSAGAKRDYLIKKLQAQRTEEERLAAAKAKAAREEAAAERDKQKLQKEGTQLTLAAGIASTVASGQKAVLAAINVITGASSLPPPANFFAIGAGLAVVISALAQARALSKTFAAGGLIEGPRHAQGGVPFTVAGQPGFEAEGGEFIFSRAAVAKHGVPFLQMLNDSASAYVKPHPNGRFATGGQVPVASQVAGTMAVAQADLSALLATNQAMLSHLSAITAHTANTAVASQLAAEKPPIVPDHETALAYEQKAKEARASMQAATL